MIELTEAAVYDLASIDNATATTWGEAQAQRYQTFLREILVDLEDEPALGSSIAQ